MVSLAGMFLTGIDVFTGLAFGTIMVVGVAVLGSLSFLPAVAVLARPWADRGGFPPRAARRTHPWASQLWSGLASRVVRRPLRYGGSPPRPARRWPRQPSACGSGNPSVDLPSNLGVVQVLDEIQHKFPGKPSPAEVVVSG